MDFIQALPKISQSMDLILVMVDRFSKTTHLLPCKKIHDSFDIAKIVLREVVRLHMVPKTITTSRNVKFISHFWKELWKSKGTILKFNSAYHL